MIFNIYYINFPKVYEIKMMLNNMVSLNKEITKDGVLECIGPLNNRTQL